MKSYAFLDIGSSALRLAVIEEHYGAWFLRAFEERRACFMYQGLICNLSAFREALAAMKKSIEEELNSTIDYVFVNVGSEHVKSFNEEDVLDLAYQKAKAQDIQKLKEQCLAKVKAQIPSSHICIHLIEQGRKTVANMQAQSLNEAYQLKIGMHAIAMEKQRYDDLQAILNQENLKVQAFVFNAVASASLFNIQQHDSFFCVVDLGAGCTDFALYFRGSIIDCGSIPLGGDAVTAQLAQDFKLTYEAAEYLKISYPFLSPNSIQDAEIIAEDDYLNLKVSIHKHDYCRSLQKSYQLIAKKIKNHLSQKAYLNHKIHFVLSGAAAQVDGIKDCFSHHLKSNVDLAYYYCTDKVPEHHRNQAQYSTLWGMMAYAVDAEKDYVWNRMEKKDTLSSLKHFFSLLFKRGV